MDELFQRELRACGCELFERFLPRMVVTAQSEESIAELVKLAARRHLRLCPTGTGSSFPANYQPPPDTVFLLTTPLDHLFELRPLDAVVTAGAGMLASDLAARLEETGLELPASVAQYRGTLGGAVLGPDSTGLRHTDLRRRLLGLHLVNPLGHLQKFGGPTVKNVAGFDFWTFLVNTHGRFGVLTRLTLNLEKVPALEPRRLAPPHRHARTDESALWIYANLEKQLDPDGIFAR